MNNAEYHADPAISASHLHAIAKSPEHYYARYLDPDRKPSTPTPAMKFGSLVHTAVLEPDEIYNRYAVCPPRNTKAGKEAAAEMAANGIEAVTQSDWDMARDMRDAVHAHPIASDLLSEGAPEQSVWWDDPTTKQRCKCRPDWLKSDGTIIDLKTTQDASVDGFAKSVARFRYHVQQAHYQNGTGAERFIFIAVEKYEPYSVGVYELDADAIAEGSRLAFRDLRRIATCRKLDEWPGYSPTITSLSLPTWAYNRDILSPEDF
ncbi:exonuclease VIII [Cyanophage KBS-S-2A]|uniref:exonuclease VIII n=1 Tax=Cyanophage KBS-S-2A TaxID=889953 RepID=UPI0002C18AF7|nr:exonuclease VIII [Cyanophage KBS-S-2A]AGH57650.1 exonuclease [Cyanophage KBS-S-2A]